MRKMSIFYKIIVFIVLLLIPIVMLYSYSNRVSVSVVENGIRDSIGGQLAYLHNRFELQFGHVARGAYQLIGDPTLNSYATLEGFEHVFDEITAKKQVEERIALQNVTMEFLTESTVFYPEDREAINPHRTVAYDEAYLREHVQNVWKARPVGGAEDNRLTFDFYFYAVSPLDSFADPLRAKQIVEIRFSDANLVTMLDDYKLANQGDPFLYHPELGMIGNHSSHPTRVKQVAKALAARALDRPDAFTLDVEGQSYLIHYIPSAVQGWTLVDYVPMKQVLQPIVNSNRLFYISTLLLLIMSIFAAFMLYRHVQTPIKSLIRNLRRVQNGDFSTRIHYTKNNEFKFVFQRFNDMIVQIQELIEHVYKEQLRSREAELKQLQSQINPHFLYNCLYYIVNMARLERTGPIERMAISLGEYFKYTTRLEKPDTKIEDELRMVGNYLEIQKLRMDRIDYELDVPAEMMKLEIPRLILQPIVENAVVHGIEPKPGGGRIRIAGQLSPEGEARLIVEDDGIGVDAEQLDEMTRQLQAPVAEGMGYGIWNVHQRMALSFGEQAGVRYALRKDGGFQVALVWKIRSHHAGH